MAIYENAQNLGGNEFLRQILTQEGVDQHRFPQGVQKSQGLVDASVSLFGFIMDDADPRWHLAHQYQRSISEGTVSSFHFEVAMTALYLGEESGRRNGYPRTMTPENLRQMCRAFQNLNARGSIQERFATSDPGLPNGVEVELALTDSIRRGRNSQGVTACPEALHQIRLYKNGIYLARVGFNVHAEGTEEGKRDIVSITNLQGTPGNRDSLEAFTEQYGVKPFNTLVGIVKDLASADGLPLMELRGLRNPKTEESAPLYNAVFRREGIPRFHFVRRQPTEPTSHQASLAVLFQPSEGSASAM